MGDDETRHLRIALLPGDGIGPEVTAEAVRLLEAVTQLEPNISFDLKSFPWNSELYLISGAMMPSDGLDSLRSFDAIYLGAIGDPRVPDHVALRQLLLRFARASLST